MPRPSSLLRKVLQRLDPRLRRQFTVQLDTAPPLPPCGGRLVLVGHRGAGKSSLLPVLATAIGVPPVDLDAVLERSFGRPIAEWVRDDVDGFRAAERQAFAALPMRAMVAVGGGFLFHHPQALARDTAVLVPVTFATYCERLRADTTRPRLLPHLPLALELKTIFSEREAAFAHTRTVPLAAVVRTLLATEEARACSGW